MDGYSIQEIILQELSQRTQLTIAFFLLRRSLPGIRT